MKTESTKQETKPMTMKPNAFLEGASTPPRATPGEPLAYVVLVSPIRLADRTHAGDFDAADGNRLTLRADGIVAIESPDGDEAILIHASRVAQMWPLGRRPVSFTSTTDANDNEVAALSPMPEAG